MSDGGLATGEAFLVSAAKSHFASVLQISSINVGSEVDSALGWVPSLHFKILDHLIVVCEVSDTPYPAIFRLRRMNVMNLNVPIAIYCVCPEEAYLDRQNEAKELMKDGYGLLTVDGSGNVQTRAQCIPLIQQISKSEFDHDISKLPNSLRMRLAECYSNYNHSAPTGVAGITEVMEGLVLRAGRDAVKKSWIGSADAKPGQPARTLTAMQGVPQLQNTTAALAAAQSYIAMYRNMSHHFPKDKKQAAAKYRDCRHGFLEGLKKIAFFRAAMKNAGLSGAV